MDDILRSWASGNTLLRARHFFWLTGPSASKSREGLLRSLLSDIVRGLSRSEDPGTVERLKQVCGPRWGVPSSDRSWRNEELKGILQGLASSSDMKLFLLVDALDECEPQDHLRDLADDILFISNLPSVKLCISCRPWMQFTGRFEGCPVLYLDRLTYRDMEIHLENRLKKAEGAIKLHGDFQQSTVPAQKLIQRTVRAAEGVFLWLELVTKALECELNKGGPFQVVDQVVTNFPVNLNDYFQKLIYERIPRSGKNILDTAAVLELAWLIAKNPKGRVIHPKNFVNIWLLLSGRLERGVSWSCNMDLLDSQTNIQRMLEETEVFLAETCKDLLVIPREDKYLDLGFLDVEFVHRTAFDFLSDNRASFNLQNHTPEHFYKESFQLELYRMRCICLLSVNGASCEFTESILTEIILNHARFDYDVDDDDNAFLSACDDISALRVQHQCNCYGLDHLTNAMQNPMDLFMRYSPKYARELCNQWPHLIVTEDGLPSFRTTMIHERKSATSGMALLNMCLNSGVNLNASTHGSHGSHGVYIRTHQTNWEAWLQDYQEFLANVSSDNFSRLHGLGDEWKGDFVILMLRFGADATAKVCTQNHISGPLTS